MDSSGRNGADGLDQVDSDSVKLTSDSSDLNAEVSSAAKAALKKASSAVASISEASSAEAISSDVKNGSSERLEDHEDLVDYDCDLDLDVNKELFCKLSNRKQKIVL